MSGLSKYWKPAVAVVLVGGIVWFTVCYWDRFLSDFWPIDKATVSPNLLASVIQWAVILIIVSLLYPPWRRAIERFASRHVDSIKQHLSSEHEKLHAKLDIMHAKQNHIIKNTRSIPNEVPGIPDEHQP
jgi:hypothetical protein